MYIPNLRLDESPCIFGSVIFNGESFFSNVVLVGCKDRRPPKFRFGDSDLGDSDDMDEPRGDLFNGARPFIIPPEFFDDPPPSGGKGPYKIKQLHVCLT